MEAAAGGASVLTFNGIAIQSTQAVYRAVCDIKHGPETVKRLASAAQEQRGILAQLQSLHTQVNRSSTATELQKAVQRCDTDTKSIHKKLLSLQKAQSDGRLHSTLKRLKTMLRKEDIKEMWACINHHICWRSE